MSTKRLWAIAGGAAALVAIIVLVATLVAPKASDAAPTPTPSATASPTTTASPTASAIPTPTVTAPVTTVATCENTSTDVFRSMMATNGWVSWESPGSPFEIFPNGAPEGQLTCTWGADPDLATDNIITLAWAPIDPENAVAAMEKLEDEGFTRITMADGTYLLVPGDPGYADAEGWGTTYFFGFDDVRWGATKADATDYVKAPDEVG